MPITVTSQPLKTPYGEEYNKIKVDWTSDGAGNATGSVDLYGYLIKVVTGPGSATPTAYGITLLSPDTTSGTALDEAGGLLSGRSTSATEVKYMTVSGNAVPVFLAGTYTFSVSSAGASKTGTAWFYLVDSL